MSQALNIASVLPRRQRRHSLARWWLAGLLVGCLLPTNLTYAEALRGGERSVVACIWVPAVLRARTRLMATRRRALRRFWVVVKPLASPKPFAFKRFVSVLVAAHDVFSRRGPPQISPFYG
ncbi:hypothetical protein SAMN04487958_10299 [Vreelandella subterranea]|uniref:Uncharacterized protein n=1 Tax=Vreelandella subterranea TaxID=416874 RepID=A0A1H9QUR7_9GAMM|nr:hypothetical protein [Halomonas subterranea]SER64198.1 hypothetical protein SAMN04487958_10299 [Halomonas subterranea]